MSIQTTFTVTWLVWYATWLLGVVWSGRTKVQMKTDISSAWRMLASVGLVLLFLPSGLQTAAVKPLTQQLWTAPAWVEWSLYALLLAAFAFCWWARLHLGRLWSSSVTRKVDHRIVDTGPYRRVRHPIYTGLIIAALATAALQGEASALFGLAVVIWGFWLKARLEERFLRAELGAEAYDAYAARTGMLAPRL